MKSMAVALMTLGLIASVAAPASTEPVASRLDPDDIESFSFSYESDDVESFSLSYESQLANFPIFYDPSFNAAPVDEASSDAASSAEFPVFYDPS